MTGQYTPTPEQRKAIQAYVQSDLTPLIEDVLVKRLGMAAVFMHETITGPTLAGGKLKEVHPNHRPDLRYILDTLAQVRPVLKNDMLRQQVDAAINGMTYIIKRTEESARGVAPAPQCPKGCGLMGTFFDGWRCNHCGETARGVAERQTIDTADHVKHGPTGETWVVARVNGEHLHPCGWPPTRAHLSDCTLVKKATPAEREKLLRDLSQGQTEHAGWAATALGVATDQPNEGKKS